MVVSDSTRPGMESVGSTMINCFVDNKDQSLLKRSRSYKLCLMRTKLLALTQRARGLKEGEHILIFLNS